MPACTKGLSVKGVKIAQHGAASLETLLSTYTENKRCRSAVQFVQRLCRHFIEISNEPRCEKTGLQGFLIWSDTNRAVQPQKMARGLDRRGIVLSV